MWRFLHGLRPEIRNAIMAEPQEVRASRDTVLSAACRHELRLANERSKANKSENAAGNSTRSPAPKPRGGSISHRFSHPNRVGKQSTTTTPYTKVESGHSNTSNKEKAWTPRCFQCGKEGHIRPNCPETPKSSKK